MDISYNCENQKFNYRVCAMIIAENKILAMHDERSPYFYLPGGRVKMGETAEQAVVREVQEELGVTPKITRPLWLNQAFFTEDVDNLHYHELCIYFLVDISETTLLELSLIHIEMCIRDRLETVVLAFITEHASLLAYFP